MKKRVILVQPKLGSWEENIIRSLKKIPLSLLCISRYVSKDYEVVIIDQRIDPQWKQRLTKELSLNPICVGTTCLTGEQIKYALEISRHVKYHSSVPMVWGGVHPSIMPEQTVLNQYVDIVVKGEGEITFFELVQALEDKKPLENIPGIFYKKDGEAVHTTERELADLNQFPPIPYELIDIHAYASDISVETSRGCPYRCRYCYNANFNRGKWRSYSAEYTINELKRLKEKNHQGNVVFLDDNFFVDIERVRSILTAIVDEKLCSSWGCSGMRLDSVSRMDGAFVELLMKSGCYSIETGVESGSDKILKSINKGITKDRILELNRFFSKFPIELSCNFVIGFPGETIEDLKETSQLIVQMIIDNPNMRISFISIFQPYPGTHLYLECIKMGLQEPQALEDWIDWSWDSVACWRTRSFNKLLDSINTNGYGLRFNKHSKYRNWLFKVVASLGRQVALFRFNHFFFGMMIENLVKRFINQHH